MRFSGNARRGTAVALAVTAAAMAAGCTGGTPASRPASAHPATATASTGAGAARAVPPVFAASFSFMSAKGGPDLGERIALLSSRTGDLLRWLTPQQEGVYDAVLSVRDGWVYFLRGPATGLTATWRVRVTGGPAQLVQAGATPLNSSVGFNTDYAISPDGRAVAYVISADRGDVLELVARNLVTGRRNTIIMATKPSPGANNWPPGISSLTWAPDDVHLAVEFSLTAAINSLLVFDAFTATTAGDGRTPPAPCTLDLACEEFDPAYLASGALTYLIERYASSGASLPASLLAWQAGRRTTLLSLPAAPYQIYDMTAQEQVIWVDWPTAPKQSWTIWRWSGGAPVEIAALPPLGASPYYVVGAIAW